MLSNTQLTTASPRIFVSSARAAIASIISLFVIVAASPDDPAALTP
jgi:hypothetical protein